MTPQEFFENPPRDMRTAAEMYQQAVTASSLGGPAAMPLEFYQQAVAKRDGVLANGVDTKATPWFLWGAAALGFLYLSTRLTKRRA